MLEPFDSNFKTGVELYTYFCFVQCETTYIAHPLTVRILLFHLRSKSCTLVSNAREVARFLSFAISNNTRSISA